MEAAFFDLDKTVVSRASAMAFAPTFYREGLIGHRSLAKGLWTQLLYVRFGASAASLERMRRAGLRLTLGWPQADVRRIVEAALASVLDPITYADAVDLIALHRRAGRRVYLVSAAPVEIVEPAARHLGMDGAIASRAAIDATGRYTGEMDHHAYGPAKALAVTAVAADDGIDLARSWAYTDSHTDLPLLELVGHPVVVNPDRALGRVARERGWEVRRFQRKMPRPTAALVKQPPW